MGPKSRLVTRRIVTSRLFALSNRVLGRVAACMIALAGLAGCATTSEFPTSVDCGSLNTPESKGADGRLDASRRFAFYALLAAKVYRDVPSEAGRWGTGSFSWPQGWRSLGLYDFDDSEPSSSSGVRMDLKFQVFGKYIDATLHEVVVVFRGTRFTSWRNWVYGNLSSSMNKKALVEVRAVVERLGADMQGVQALMGPKGQSGAAVPKLTLVGHSLGAEIAAFVGSQLHAAGSPHVDAVLFNLPVYACKHVSRNVGGVARFHDLREKNEVLSPAGGAEATAWAAADCPSQKPFDFIRNFAVRQHSMDWLAINLIRLADSNEPESPGAIQGPLSRQELRALAGDVCRHRPKEIGKSP